jgi:hypothetical protein
MSGACYEPSGFLDSEIRRSCTAHSLIRRRRFYPLLEPIWWRMRDLVFEPKPPPKGRVDRKRNARIDGIAEDAYEVSAALISTD